MITSPRKKAAAYARTSTILNQSPDAQLFNIREFANARQFELVAEYTDQLNGIKEKRPGLDKLVKTAQRGEFQILIVTAIDRVGRSTKHLLGLIDELNHYGVSLISISQGIDFSSPTGRMTLTILSAVASLERELCRERIRSSLAARKLIAQRTGSSWRCGRPLVVTPELEQKITNLRECGHSIRQIHKLVDRKVSTTTIQNVIARMKQGPIPPAQQTHPNSDSCVLTTD